MNILKNHNGFSLIETIIVIVIIGIAAIGVLSVFITGMKGAADPLITIQVIELAQEKMDIVIGDRQNTARGYSYATTPANYPAESPISGFANFNRSIAIACVTTADFNAAGSAPAPSCVGVTNYARVTVTVTHAVIGSVTTVTLLTNY
ncbi:MAG: prepilin-type N-terminal cleavage/methylation domain-containing protein [Nitrospirota bacterium]